MPTVDEILQQGKAHHRAGDLHAAERLYRQAVEIDADSLEAHYLLGTVSHALGRPDAAVAELSRAVQLRPEFAEAHHHLGVVFTQQGKLDDALACYRRAIELKPEEANAHLNLGVLYDLYLSQPQKALDEFERYIELAGENKQVAGWVVELRKRVAAPARATKKEPA